MDQFFKIGDRGSSVATELRAGLTTFLAMAYIIVVNPLILEAGGVPVTAAVTATCVGAGIMTILMGVCANRPLACASGMGINSIVAYTLCGSMGLGWQTAMAVVLIEGIAILLLVLCGLREAIMEAIPVSLRRGISIGLGLFIAMIGLKDGGIILANADTLVSLGSVTDPTFLVGAISIVATVVLYSMKVKGALLWGIVIAAVCGIPLGVTQTPAGIVAPLDFSTFGAPFMADADGVMGLVKAVSTPTILLFAFSLMMSDFFDTMGTAMAVAKQGEFLTEDGKVEDIKPILVVDSAAAAVGGLMGASSITTFVESASGAADGGRTGLTSLVTAIMFLICIPFSGLIGMVPSAATSPALIVVGILMVEPFAKINWTDFSEAVPAFFTVAVMSFTYGITNGIAAGFIMYCITLICTKKAKDIHPIIAGASILFLVDIILKAIG